MPFSLLFVNSLKFENYSVFCCASFLLSVFLLPLIEHLFPPLYSHLSPELPLVALACQPLPYLNNGWVLRLSPVSNLHPDHSPGYRVIINTALQLAPSQRPSDVTPTCLHDLFRITSSWPALSHVINIAQMLITSLQRSVWSLAFRNLLSWLRHAVLQFFYDQSSIYFCFATLIFKPW